MAAALLQHFGSLEGIYANLDRVPEMACRGAKALALRLEAHREAAMLARRLTGIACDAPLERPLACLKPAAPDLGAVNALFDRAGIGAALRRQAVRVSDIVAEPDLPRLNLRTA